MPFPCPNCDKSFNYKGNLNVHLQRAHHLEPLRDNKKKSVKCPQCDFSCVYHTEYRTHLKSEHGINATINSISFSTVKEFEDWKANNERTNKWNTYLAATRKLSSGEKKMYFRCHRSGYYVDKIKEQRKRRLKSSGSNKMSASCPAFIEAIHRSGGSIEVNYCDAHFGHDRSLGRTKLKPEDRVKFAGMIQSGTPLETIIENVRNSITNPEIERVHLITRKDLLNIKRDFALYPEDRVSVDMWVKRMKKSNNSPVLFYKAAGKPDTVYKFGDEDFCVFIMSKFQSEMLQKFGTGLVCVDFIENVEVSSCEQSSLSAISVVDDIQAAIPVAYCLSNKRDNLTWKAFFDSIQKKLESTVSCNIFMSVDDISYCEAWDCIMGPAKSRVICPWQVERVWETSLNEVPDKKKKDHIYKVLKSLLMESNQEKFNNDLLSFINDLNCDEGVTFFRNFFIENYANRAQMWAACHRQASSDGCLEELHKQMMNICANKNKHGRLVGCIYALTTLSRDKMLERAIKIEKGTPSFRIRTKDESSKKVRKQKPSPPPEPVPPPPSLPPPLVQEELPDLMGQSNSMRYTVPPVPLPASQNTLHDYHNKLDRLKEYLNTYSLTNDNFTKLGRHLDAALGLFRPVERIPPCPPAYNPNYIPPADYFQPSHDSVCIPMYSLFE